MLKKTELNRLIDWFKDYTNTFKSDNKEYTRNIKLKIDHTFRVCKEMVELSKSLKLSKCETNLAESIALLHDIGRFEQYHKHKSFADHKSENHALLGTSTLTKTKILESISPKARETILFSVFHHNQATLPNIAESKKLFFLKMVRDADKLDIFHLVADYYRNEEKIKNVALELGLPKTNKISKNVIADIESGNIVKTRHLKTLNDFKLLQISWIYDINFTWSFQRIKKQKLLNQIFKTLPQNDKIKMIFNQAISFLEEKSKT